MNATEPTKPAPSRAELEAKHGTPADFADAAMSPLKLGCVSYTENEAIAATREYEREWSAAK